MTMCIHSDGQDRNPVIGEALALPGLVAEEDVVGLGPAEEQLGCVRSNTARGRTERRAAPNSGVSANWQRIGTGTSSRACATTSSVRSDRPLLSDGTIDRRNEPTDFD